MSSREWDGCSSMAVLGYEIFIYIIFCFYTSRITLQAGLTCILGVFGQERWGRARFMDRRDGGMADKIKKWLKYASESE